MRLNFRGSPIAFVMVFTLGSGLLAGSSAAVAGCNSGNFGNDLLGSANCEANASGASSTAVGFAAGASGANSTSVGAYSGTTLTPANGATSIGAYVGGSLGGSGVYSTAVGAGAGQASAAKAVGDYSVAMGGGDGTPSGGTGAVAFTARSIAIGNSSGSTGSQAIAVGYAANAGGDQSTAVGQSTSASFANSAAFGNGATTIRANQQSFGTAANTYTFAGVTSAASLAAQSGPIKVVTTDANGNLAAASFSPQDISGLQSNVTTLQQNVGVLQHQMKQGFEGTAIAIALGGAALPDNKKFAISTNWGNFRGQNAVGVAAQFRLTDYAVANVGVGGGFQQGGIGSRAGVMFAW